MEIDGGGRKGMSLGTSAYVSVLHEEPFWLMKGAQEGHTRNMSWSNKGSMFALLDHKGCIDDEVG